MCLCLSSHNACAYKGQKRACDPLHLALQEAVSHPVWTLRDEQPSSMILGLALLWLRVYRRSPVLGELLGSAEEAGECGREVPA